MENQRKIYKYEFERMRMELGLRIKALRIRRRLNLEGYSKVFSIKKERLEKIEKGKIFPSLNTISRIIIKENVHPSFLFSFFEDFSDVLEERVDFYNIVWLELTDYDHLRRFFKASEETKKVGIRQLQLIKEKFESKYKQGTIKWEWWKDFE